METAVGTLSRSPIAILIVFSCVIIAVVYAPAFLGLRVIPYDFVTSYYGWYVDAIRGFWSGDLSAYNPYGTAGIPGFTLLGDFDPIDALPALFHQIPSLVGYQALVLGHLAFIPIGLAMVAYARGANSRQMLLVAAPVIACIGIGPELKYIEWSKPVEAYCYGFLVMGFLELLRTRLRLRYAVGLGASLAYAFIYFGENVYWPLFVIPYVIIARQAFLNRRGILLLIVAVVVALGLALPSAIVAIKFFQTIDIAQHAFTMASDIAPIEVLGYLGVPASGGDLSLAFLPFCLVVFAFFGIRGMGRAERFLFGCFTVSAAVYALGEATPFVRIVQFVYPIARMSTRPDAVLYALIPVVAAAAVCGIVSIRTISARWAGAVIGAYCLFAVLDLGLRADPTWRIVAAVLLVIPLIFARDIRWWSLGLVAQWLVLACIPFWHSSWAPQPLAYAGGPFTPYTNILQYLPRPNTDSLSLYRVANVALPAEFGGLSGVLPFYSVGADYGALFPHVLLEKLQIPSIHDAYIAAEVVANPLIVGSPGMRDLAVRYYFLNPEVFRQVGARLQESPGLVNVPSAGPWIVIRDDLARPFVFGVRGKSVVPISASVERGHVRLVVPPGLERIELSFNYDTWWHATSDDHSVSDPVLDDGGQLALDTRSLSGRTIDLRYGNVFFEASEVGYVLIYAAAFIAFLVIFCRRRASHQNHTTP